MTTGESPLSTRMDFHDELQSLLRRAHQNDVDVVGGWDCRNGDGHPDWDVVVTEVRKHEPTD